ncbi:hypothetical protein [Nonomuraea rhizosphaerae]|uniref:hypothetical protein n=1 Tax=Nonomuraea rhizosphaerae TaxID=2665663 RepID=UPI0027E31049|nr:hypothetical protein [Nonomuraea rhizosphaerae]
MAVRPDRSVVLGTTQAGDRVLLGYTSAATYARHRGSHSLSACNPDTILDIQRVTGVREIVIDAAGPAAAAVPIDDLQRYLASTRTGPTPVMSGAAPAAYATGAMATVSRGAALAQVAPPAPDAPALPWIPAPRPHLSGPMQQVDPGYRRCTHPILPALRRAISHLLMDYPLVHHVWISEARTASGAPGIMLHVKVHMSAAEDVVRDLHRGVRARLPQFAASGAPILMARVADSRSEQRMVEIGAHVVCADVAD